MTYTVYVHIGVGWDGYITPCSRGGNRLITPCRRGGVDKLHHIGGMETIQIIVESLPVSVRRVHSDLGTPSVPELQRTKHPLSSTPEA